MLPAQFTDTSSPARATRRSFLPDGACSSPPAVRLRVVICGNLIDPPSTCRGASAATPSAGAGRGADPEPSKRSTSIHARAQRSCPTGRLTVKRRPTGLTFVSATTTRRSRQPKILLDCTHSMRAPQRRDLQFGRRQSRSTGDGGCDYNGDSGCSEHAAARDLTFQRQDPALTGVRGSPTPLRGCGPASCKTRPHRLDDCRRSSPPAANPSGSRSIECGPRPSHQRVGRNVGRRSPRASGRRLRL